MLEDLLRFDVFLKDVVEFEILYSILAAGNCKYFALDLVAFDTTFRFTQFARTHFPHAHDDRDVLAFQPNVVVFK